MLQTRIRKIRAFKLRQLQKIRRSKARATNAYIFCFDRSSRGEHGILTTNDYEKTTTRTRKETVTEEGFTILELLITLAIIAIITSLAASPNLKQGNAQKSFANTLNTFQTELSELRNESMTRNTTTRMIITSAGGVYTINTYYSATAVTTCNAATVSTALVTNRPLSIHSKYQLTGGALTNICFYRDGTSSGGTFTISPIVPTAGLKTATVIVTIATGFLDAVVE